MANTITLATLTKVEHSLDQGPQTIQQIANDQGIHPYAVKRALNYLSSIGRVQVSKTGTTTVAQRAKRVKAKARKAKVRRAKEKEKARAREADLAHPAVEQRQEPARQRAGGRLRRTRRRCVSCTRKENAPRVTPIAHSYITLRANGTKQVDAEMEHPVCSRTERREVYS